MPGAEWQSETKLIPGKWRRARQTITARQFDRAANEVGKGWKDELRRTTSVQRWTYAELRRNPLFARAHPSGVDPALVGAHTETGRAMSKGWGWIVSVFGSVAWIYIFNRVPYAKFFGGQPTKRMIGRPVTKRAWADIKPLRGRVLQRLGIPLREK